MTVEIGIASAGRPAMLQMTVSYIQRTMRQPTKVNLSIPSQADLGGPEGGLNPASRIVIGARGLAAQRNALLDTVDADILVFFDDDFLPCPDYIAETVQLFRIRPDIVVATGEVLADGARTGGMDFECGIELLKAAGPNDGGNPYPAYGAYGCNMVIRMAPVRQHRLRFDENLPLYGWQEDIDFSRQLAPYGSVVRSPRLRGVHLGTKRSGRSPGRQLGYSQVANPYYLVKKGTMSRRFAWRLVRNNVGGNILRFAKPEPSVDRRGRLLGNLMAMGEILTGRCHPTRIVDL